MKRFRFSVLTLLVATTAVAIVLGVAMWRYRIVRELNQLFAEGVSFDRDEFESVANISWFSTPDYADIFVFQNAPDEYRFEKTTYSRKNAIAYGKSLEDRLKALGVTDINIYFQWQVGGGIAQKVFYSFDEMPNRVHFE